MLAMVARSVSLTREDVVLVPWERKACAGRTNRRVAVAVHHRVGGAVWRCPPLRGGHRPHVHAGRVVLPVFDASSPKHVVLG